MGNDKTEGVAKSWLASIRQRFVRSESVFYGVYPAMVVDVVDPDSRGRVKVLLPRSPGGDRKPYELWARLATMMGGNDRGTWFIPDVGDRVLVAFEAGDPWHPYIVGALWDEQETLPEEMDNHGKNYLKTILSREHVRITLDDTRGAVKLRLEIPNGPKLILGDVGNSVVIQDSNGNSIKIESSGITLAASSKVTINASTADISAAIVKVDAAMSKFSGVVQCETLISNNVVSSTYTPGAGNVW